jgi:hypothetical protein
MENGMLRLDFFQRLIKGSPWILNAFLQTPGLGEADNTWNLDSSGLGGSPRKRREKHKRPQPFLIGADARKLKILLGRDRLL